MFTNPGDSGGFELIPDAFGTMAEASFQFRHRAGLKVMNWIANGERKQENMLDTRERLILANFKIADNQSEVAKTRMQSRCC